MIVSNRLALRFNRSCVNTSRHLYLSDWNVISRHSLPVLKIILMPFQHSTLLSSNNSGFFFITIIVIIIIIVISLISFYLCVCATHYLDRNV